MENRELEIKSWQLRQDIVDIIMAGKGGHIGGDMSVLNTLLVLGGNNRAAKLSGVNVDRITILVYILSGFSAAMVGLINTAQLAAAHPASGDSWEMNAIAATVLGGTSMSGGSGTILGTIVGAFVIGVINDGMTMCGVSEFWQKVIRGLVIILAVIIDQAQRKLEAKMALQVRNETN